MSAHLLQYVAVTTHFVAVGKIKATGNARNDEAAL